MHRIRALEACLLLVALASCQGKELQADGVKVLVGTDDGNDMAGVGLEGEVTLVGECLGLGESLIIWPPGTKIIAEDPLAIKVPDLGIVRVGDHIEGGGQTYHIADPPDGLEIPSGCRSDRLHSFFPNH